jgi:hypothetical protein
MRVVEVGTHTTHNSRRGAVALVGLALATLAATLGTTSVASASGHAVDPSTLTPPPPAEFNPVCKSVGGRTICDVVFTDPAVVAEPTGIACGTGSASFEPVVSWTRSVQGKRYYDRNGNLTERHFHDLVVGTYTNPLTGASVPFRQHDTNFHLLAVPGDINTGTEAVTVSVRVAGPHGGTVLIDAGRTVFAESDGTILFEAGQHPFDAYFVFGDTSALQPLCDALA